MFRNVYKSLLERSYINGALFGTERTMHHMVKMAYARVSAKGQNPERQLLKFRELGIEERFTFIDKQSGKYFNRIRYNAMRLMLREGDLLYLYALDRLGQDIMAFLCEWKYITPELKADILCIRMRAYLIVTVSRPWVI